jgi:hypothetical protein
MGSYEGRGPQTDKTPVAKVPFMTFGIAFYQSNLSMELVHQQRRGRVRSSRKLSLAS